MGVDMHRRNSTTAPLLIILVAGNVVGGLSANTVAAQTVISGGEYHSPAISSEGGHVAFVAEQGGGRQKDIFVRDLRQGTIEAVSYPPEGAPNGSSFNPAISADGRYVAFESLASNLVPGDTNGEMDIFVRDTVRDTTTRASVSTNGTEVRAESLDPSISGDGRFVVFDTAGNLASNDTNGVWGDPRNRDVYVRDTVANTTTVVSVDQRGVAAGNSWDGDISPDGAHACFTSASSAVVPTDANAVNDVFLRSFSTQSTILASLTQTDAQANANSSNCDVASEGATLLFYSSATNLVSGDTNGFLDVFARYPGRHRTVWVSVDTEGDHFSMGDSQLSDDGRFVGFDSGNSTLVDEDTNNHPDMFVKNLTTDLIYRASVNSAGAQADNQTIEGGLSGDGRMIVFSSDANNLSSGDGWLTRDIFVHDRAARTTRLVSRGGSGSEPQRPPHFESPDECADLRICVRPGPLPPIGPVNEAVRSVVRQLPRTPKNQVLVANANVIQAYATAANPNHHEDCDSGSKTCRSNGRELNFAERVDGLSHKTRGPLDGMGAPPDIVLLQEARTDDLLRERSNGEGLTGIAAHLEELTGYTYKIAVSDDHPEISARDENDDGRIDTKLKSDGAILYNADTMLKRGVAEVTSTYDKETEGCPQDPLPPPADFDRDGDDDCEYAKHKRHYLAQFVERKQGSNSALPGGLRIAVANVHFVTASHLKGGNGSPTHEALVDRWTQEVIGALHGEFPLAEAYMMGGDWNAERCRDDPDPSAPEERRTCVPPPERLWWINATQDGFVDGIYAQHGASDTTLSNQYRDGCLTVSGNSCSAFNYREKRIDFVFHEAATLITASHDLTCGISDRRSGRSPNCDDLKNHDRYSDHRLVWTLLQG